MAVGGIAGNLYSSRRQDPGAAEFVAWACLFGAAEVIAGLMPVTWGHDMCMVIISDGMTR